MNVKSNQYYLNLFYHMSYSHIICGNSIHMLIHWVATHDPWTLSITLEWSKRLRSRGENSDADVDDLT